MEEKLISVILPTHNRAETLQKAVFSVLNQTYKNLELIIVDDASEDNTAEVVKNITDPRIRYRRSSVQKGANIARNTGLEQASGELIAFLDSADGWMPEKLEKQVRFMDETEAEIVFCAEKVVSAWTAYTIPFATQKAKLARGAIEELLASENCIDTSTLLVKKKCFDEVGRFHPELPRLQEYEWLIRAVQKFKISYLDEVLVEANIRADSISADLSKLLHAVPVIFCEHNAFFEKHGRAAAFLFSPVKKICQKGGDYPEYKTYFDIVDAVLKKKYAEDQKKMYEETVRYLAERDSVNRRIQENMQNGDTFLEVIKRDKARFCVFGAGEDARRLIAYLSSRGLETAVEAVIVTRLLDNAESKFAVPMTEVKQCGGARKALPVILAVSADVTYEVLHELEQEGFEKIICLTDEERRLLEGEDGKKA